MKFIFLCLILVISGWLIYRYFFKKKKSDIDDRAWSIENIGVGGSFSVSNLEDKNHQVVITKKFTHQEGDAFWVELEGENNEGKPFWISVDSIDPLELSGGCLELSLSELSINMHDLKMSSIGQEICKLESEVYTLERSGEAQVFDHKDDEVDWMNFHS